MKGSQIRVSSFSKRHMGLVKKLQGRTYCSVSVIQSPQKWFITSNWYQKITFDKLHTKFIFHLCQLPRLTFWDHKVKTPHASHGILEINYKSPPCLIWISPNKLKTNPLPITMTEYLPYFIVKFKIKCLPASWLMA